jgi:hypothetical protein
MTNDIKYALLIIMIRKKSSPASKLDREEKDILRSFEKGEWKSINALNKEKKRAQNTAKRTFLTDVR